MNIRFWAKTSSAENPGIDVLHHSLNVGRVAELLAGNANNLINLWKAKKEEISTMAALHDIGKISPGFQQKCPAWLKDNKLFEKARQNRWDTFVTRHTEVTHYAVQKLFLSMGMQRKSAMYWAAALGAHHGYLQRPNERGFDPGQVDETSSGILWESSRLETAKNIIDTFYKLPTVQLSADSPLLWWFAGLTSVADWIGSDERYFPPERGLSGDKIMEASYRAVSELGLNCLEINKKMCFEQMFKEGFSPYDLQQKAMDYIKGPGVYVIEAPMGMGKTEAALAVAYRLLESGKATGIYFALPTQATSNRIHLRMQDFVLRICPSRKTRLIHGNSWLIEGIEPLYPAKTVISKSEHEGDAQNGRDWFTSAKRALIAPFGVGTVDQALLGVVAVKYFFVRHFALAGKVVIIDEVHSYDLYTGTLVDKLVDLLAKLGCTVIILSATLTGKRRNTLLKTDGAEKDKKDPYPLICGRTPDGKAIKPIPVNPPENKSIKTNFNATNNALARAIEAAKDGAAILWICDTVDSAQDTYHTLMREFGLQGPVLGLLHARFPFYRRQEIEEDWMSRLGKDETNRKGCILVSTQIVEQSVDLDADLIISELAPIDMLLQRIGRLWRHDRKQRPVKEPELIIIQESKPFRDFKTMSARDIKKAFGSKALIYEPYVLLRTLSVLENHLAVLKNHSRIILPKSIRSLLADTYADINNEPEAWVELFCEMKGKACALNARALMAVNIWSNPALFDEEGEQTRINDLPTVSLILVINIFNTEFEMLDGSVAVIRDDVFNLDAARALHRNLVRIPLWPFEESGVQPHTDVQQYVRGLQTIGMVDCNSGKISVKGLKTDIDLHWSNELGVRIINRKTGET